MSEIRHLILLEPCEMGFSLLFLENSFFETQLRCYRLWEVPVTPAGALVPPSPAAPQYQARTVYRTDYCKSLFLFSAPGCALAGSELLALHSQNTAHAWLEGPCKYHEVNIPPR